MTVNWTREEFEAKRRLVRFVRTVQGSKIQLHCEAITQERYDEQKGLDQWLDNEITISCIWREDTRSYCFTSVNVIDLLEMLLTRDAREEFPASEKGSIRRNLDNLGPTTVSKDRHGLERVFKTIMMFPEPKPFTIEKTVKVFDWMVLEKALKRAVAKYVCFWTCPRPEPSTHVVPCRASSPPPVTGLYLLKAPYRQKCQASTSVNLPTLRRRLQLSAAMIRLPPRRPWKPP
ncbi:hypothetical protein PUNSTDRAFT_59302 [Punctularia strigosozonata HHB-11173 SS5]|uniref:uncharacterized protein n=1 Tax=Punctularia strigosozonata (strain HHB-11173) TaxID=741275 RepID=UPI00044162CE|nr:uncharacterized protein PUNSTDRAFT_59302 [Punctularia strigosozonata HHB-11173 SS5]EIN13290.1 hypothetical protein PUNSTDRAFT_59302 [Punctularia strigosozonata HHB-11173 SS5]